DGKLVFNMNPFEIKTFAVRLADATVSEKSHQAVVELPYNKKITTFNCKRDEAVIPQINVSVPAEIFPATIECSGVKFKTGEVGEAKADALIAQGQTLSVYGKKLYFIGASLKGDKTFDFKVGNETVSVSVQAIDERIGIWDLYDLKETAKIKTDKLAWECTHSHSVFEDIAAKQLCFFMYELNIGDADTVTLPEDPDLLILAATQSRDGSFIRLETQLYDRADGRKFDYKMNVKEKLTYNFNKRISKKTPNKS
ncbi:MAG: hypothetical protein IIX36_03660, partial [Clostridia bacterium]|nr:hypothetical protein [Clostridia bacterium]